jgi:type IV pilus assembly protein PilC
MWGYWWAMLLAVVLLWIIIRMIKSTDGGRYHYDAFMLKVPVFGKLFSMVALSRFSKTFATLIRSGVPILGALEIVEGTVGNRVIEKAVEASRDSIRTGESLSTPLARSPAFPPMVVRMIAIGEKTGALEQLLEKISEFYEQQTASMVEQLTSLIEPIMIGVMGLIVGGIVLSIILPILKIQQAVR